ncbi:hypothetical protein NP493_1061g00038 [Ridgeia piscesae]|uniref:Fucolectin tachylectin-4 pentraxin-1 domain-containing protein n=1 Tax=Ridgeia piscesae TaxID=27915 RepID=A0AAD9NIF5_RIDPI|nr:hypothetical protein NP493_1061g00038 [Ridgeia piscesae]
MKVGQSCSHTKPTDYPWWAVDLGSARLVLSVDIYNRVDCNCSERLHDLRVGLMNTWPTTGGSSLVVMDTICATLDGPRTEARYMTQCEKNAVGRYLVIQIDAVKSELSLCEVEVFVHQRKY